MIVTLALLAASTGGLPNLDFAAGLTHWEGDGFTAAKGQVSSADRDGKGRTAVLHRTFTVPAGVREVRFQAALVRPDGFAAGGTLDVVLEGAGRDYLPRRVREGEKWVAAPTLLPAEGGRLRSYSCDTSRHAGRRVRIALVDSDARPGCHVVASGFELVTGDDLNARDFSDVMRKLEKTHKLRRAVRYDSRHFMAMSNADVAQTEYRLYNCETIHALFFRHFRRRGFEAREPAERMMVAIFDSHQGMEAYLGEKVSQAITGVYNRRTNRLVVYDYATNPVFVAGKRRLEDQAKRGATDLERERRMVTFGRFVRDRRDDTNLSTMMHEVAHQLSFNCGLLNRDGDVPVWLAEGLAVYCESTVNGAWQGIGESNPSRARALAAALQGRGGFLPLQKLVGSDDWIRKAKTVNEVVLGYAQSWALFRLLMEEQPKKLKAYLEMIHPRRANEHRLGDFGAAFGSLERLERRYQEYLRTIARNEGKER
jgi:hypothetical protein